MKEQNFVSAVLYCRNIADTISKTLDCLIKILASNFSKWELICVEDFSSDKTGETIKAFAERFKGSSAVTLVRTGYYQGIERSMTAGVDLAIGDFVFEFDTAEFVFDPGLIMDVYRHCLEGYDIVSASPRSRKSVLSNLFYKLLNKHSGTQYALVSEDFRIISRRAINRVNQMSSFVPYRKVLYANCGLKSDNYVFEPQVRIKRKFDSNEKAFRRSLAIDSFILFTNLAYRISFALSIFMLCVSLFSIVYTVAVFVAGNPIAGWTTTMLLLSAGLSGLFGVLTLVVKYLSVLIKLTFEKRKYVIGSIEKLC